MNAHTILTFSIAWAKLRIFATRKVAAQGIPPDGDALLVQARADLSEPLRAWALLASLHILGGKLNLLVGLGIGLSPLALVLHRDLDLEVELDLGLGARGADRDL